MASIINAATSGGLVTSADTSGILQLQTAGTTAMTVDASQNVGVGVTPSAWYSGVKAVQFGTAGAVWSSYDRANLTANLYLDAATAFRYINNGFALRYAQEVGAHAWYTAPSGTAGNVISFTQVLAVEGSKSLALEGATSQSGTGITFPATQSASSNANTLDDYEEGTWTPSLAGTATYTRQDGNYTKVGRLVNIRCNIVVSSIGTGSTSQISGLPFTTANTPIGNPPASGVVGYFGSLAVSPVYISTIATAGGTTINVSGLTAAGNTASAGLGVFGNSARIDFTMTYYVD